MTSPDETTASSRVFPADAFTWLLPGHGAAKLSSSGVAPLVAAARGYMTVTPDNLRQQAEALRLTPMNSAGATQLKKAVADEDAMVMPWVRMDSTLENARRGTKATPTAIQFRPSTPVINDDGEPSKYLNIRGVPTVLDVNPATPAEWFLDAPRILLTEGIIKGDSTLTALLRHHGVSEETLGNDHGGDPVAARAALREAMKNIPVEDRVLIISFVGVANWRQNPEWTSLHLAGREPWIAYDTDVATNAQVWKQASDLVTYLEGSRKTKPARFINVPPVAGDPKAGLDDYFAAPPEDGGGTWADVESLLGELPDRPSTEHGGEDVGALRVHPDGHCVEESVAVNDPTGRMVGTRWEPIADIGGRIKSVELTRAPTDEEIETGILGKGVGSEGDPGRSKLSGVEIELTWKDPANPDRIVTANVTGPAAILNYRPVEWPRQGARIPFNVLRHPKWPPKEGDKWLEAIKTNRPEETIEKVRWSSMGWVPSDEGAPQFIVGSQIVTADGIVEDADTSIIGVTDHELPGAEDFGVIAPDHDRDGTDEKWMAQAKADLEEVWAAYIDSGAWTDQNVAATVLAIGLRPALPLPCQTVGYMVGRPRSGKSWTAAATMAFWTSKVPGAWHNNHLPGKATDTVASMENAVARTPIWVADDLAPSTDRRQASSQEAALGDLIRSVFNRSGKRRMKADMSARDVNKPKALLVLTAENEPSVHSISERIVRLTFGSGSLNPDRNVTSKVVATYSETGAAARLAGAFIRWHAWRAKTADGWADLYSRWSIAKDAARASAAEIISGSSDQGQADRHATMAADLMVTYSILAEFARDIGADKRIVRACNREMQVRVANQVAAAHDAQESSAPGRSTIEAIATLLRSGQGHIAHAEMATSAPSNDDLRNLVLGWVPGTEQGQMRPTGRTIGWLLKTRDGKQEVALLDPKTAFNEAQRAYPDIIPYGNKANQAWAAVWDEGLALSPDHGGWKRRSNGRSPLNTVDVTVGGTRLRGVPVPINVLIGATTSATNLGDVAESDDGEEDYGEEDYGEEQLMAA